ncbi:sulfotransferase [Vibrio salinus]|uniref:sulfotransferase n=1 Tax=Vibrio salinus TaxID=2899784 RepID=UPI001E5E645E|nr:sulfotransferase [Vibrio salinus]MCE0494144.1 sulfotransferase [Vibrio salinus]
MNITYSLLDKSLHHLAFHSTTLKALLSDIESELFSKNYSNIPVSKPVFITSLPRAGTTILLMALSRCDQLYSYSYRNMPFIMNPVIWNYAAKLFRKNRTSIFRAHNDGIQIDYNSPEAFEEVVWKHYYPDRFQSDSISLWPDNDSSFQTFFNTQIKKCLYTSPVKGARYLSKNNANISRIPLLKNMFPDSFILIPFRHPISHVYSLFDKHRLFTKIHTDDNFSIRYMEDIGHYEFGHLHKPISFPGFQLQDIHYQPDNINYWLHYWISAYKYLIEFDSLHFICYESLCRSPGQSVSHLLSTLNINVSDEERHRAVAVLKPSNTHSLHDYDTDAGLLSEANHLYQELLSKCLLATTNQSPPPKGADVIEADK